MVALLLCCAVVALASHGCAQVSLEYEPTAEATHRRRDRAARDWLGYSVRDDDVQILDLASQGIQRVPRAAFRNTPNAARIYMSNNSISDIEVGAFEGVPEIWMVDLDNNDISSLPEGVFSPMPKLERIFLSGNRIAELSPSHFAGLPRLLILEVNNNRAQLHLHNRTLADLPRLYHVTLSGSNIRTLPRGVFTGSNRLAYIYLDDNQIEELDNSTFNGLSKLKWLGLSRNRLQALQPAAFDDLPSLTKLDLSYNTIHYLSEENMNFRWSPTVNLTKNRIQYFDPHVYNKNQRVPTFILDNNPYHCSCSLLSFTQKYSNKDILLPTLEIDKATCDAPAHLRGTALSQLSEDSLGACDTTPPDTPADSITTTEVPRSVIETSKQSSFTTPPIPPSTSSTPSPATPPNTLRDILSLIPVIPAASPGSHRNGRNNIYISGPFIFLNIFNSSASPSSIHIV